MDGLFLARCLRVQVGYDVLAVIYPPDAGRIFFSKVFGNLKIPGARKYRALFFPVHNGVKSKGAFVEFFAVSGGRAAASHQYQKGEKRKRSHESKIRLRRVSNMP